MVLPLRCHSRKRNNIYSSNSSISFCRNNTWNNNKNTKIDKMIIYISLNKFSNSSTSGSSYRIRANNNQDSCNKISRINKKLLPHQLRVKE